MGGLQTKIELHFGVSDRLLKPAILVRWKLYCVMTTMVRRQLFVGLAMADHLGRRQPAAFISASDRLGLMFCLSQNRQPQRGKKCHNHDYAKQFNQS